MSGINLLPNELKEERKKAQFNFRVSSICFSILLIFVLGLIGLEAANQILGLTLKASQTQIQFEEQEIAKLKDIDQKAKQIDEILTSLSGLEKNQILWTKILKDLTVSTPTALQITSFVVNSKTPNFTIVGVAASRREIAKFKEKLESSSYFSNVAFVSSDLTQTERGIFYNFNLQADFEDKR